MNWLLISRMLGMMALLVGGSMAFSLPWAFPVFGVATQFERGGFWGLISSMGVCIVLGLLLLRISRADKSSMLRKEALAVVGLGWIMAGGLGALPFLLSGTARAKGVPMHAIDALFESVSGFTTTGGSVLTELEDPELVPRCIMFWRSFTHWLGGMGIVVLFVALLRQLGASGKALMKHEVPGPTSEGVRPRVQETALWMWAIYVGLSVIQTILLMISGQSMFEALCHTFGTMATGGFSTRNASVGAFNGGAAEYIILCFMVLAGINFSLYYIVLKKPQMGGRFSRLRPVLRDSELRAYLGILLMATAFLSFNLFRHDRYETMLECIRHAAFNTVSIMTTTGFGSEDYTHWGELSKGVLLALMFVGGCSGSTGGGMKVIRIVLFAKIIRLELERAFRPNIVRPLRLGGVSVEDGIRRDVTFYVGLMVCICLASWLALVAIEPDVTWHQDGHSQVEKLGDCASAVAATVNNIGPGIGVLGPARNYSEFSLPGKALLTFLMLLGRLEFFAILVLLMPSFYRNQ